MADFLRQNDLDSILKLAAQLALTVLMDACQELLARHNKEPIADETNDPVVFFQKEQCGDPSDYAEVDEHVLHCCCAALCVIGMTNDVEFGLPREKSAIQAVVNIIRTRRSALLAKACEAFGDMTSRLTPRVLPAMASRRHVRSIVFCGTTGVHDGGDGGGGFIKAYEGSFLRQEL